MCWTCGQEYDKKLAEIKRDLIEQNKNKPLIPPPITTGVKLNKRDQEAELALSQEVVKQAPLSVVEEKKERKIEIVTTTVSVPASTSIKEEPQQENIGEASPESDEHDLDVDSDPPPSYNSDGDNNLLPEDEEEMKEDFEIMSDGKMDIEEPSLSVIEDYDMSEDDKTKRSNGAYRYEILQKKIPRY